MKYRIIAIITIITLVIFTILLTSTQDHAINKVDTQHLESTNTCSKDESIEDCSKLPIVTINTNNQEIPGMDKDNTKISVDLSIIDNESNGNHLTDTASISEKAKIEYRGQSSLHFKKKGLNITFIDDNDDNKKVSVMGMEKSTDWVLHGPYLDKTLIRNYLWYHISAMMMDSAPTSKFCRLYIDGEYQGLYLMVEAATTGTSSRMVVNKTKKNTSVNGYIFQLNSGNGHFNQAKKINTFGSITYTNNVGYYLMYPSINKITDEQVTEIEKDISYYEKILYSYDYDSNRYGYEKFIDIESFVDYFIINEFTLNTDAGIRSTYVYKGVDNKFRMYVWDFNNANDNYMEQATDSKTFRMPNTFWYFMLMKDPDFVESIIARYKYLRTNILSDEYLNNYIDEINEYLGEEIDYNYTKWDVAFSDNLLVPASRNIKSYDEALTQLKTNIKERGEYMDTYIDTLRQFSNEAKIKKFNH